MGSLLEQIRQLNETLKQSAIHRISFNELTKTLSEILSANIYVSTFDGTILSYSTSSKFPCEINDKNLEEKCFPKDFNDELLSYEDTISNWYLQNPLCIYTQKDCIYTDRYMIVVPILYNARRLGNTVFAKYNEKFSEDEIIVCEYASAIVSMEMIKRQEEQLREKMELITNVQMAYAALSYSEQEAISLILDNIKEEEGLIVASALANDANITKSVISNALRKLESAGVIQTRSLGMKGTYIKINNPYLKSESEKLMN